MQALFELNANNAEILLLVMIAYGVSVINYQQL